ncbi:Rqc2 family fibronectin-binding protein, partial [Clostridium neonatale]
EYVYPPISNKLDPFSCTYENLNSFITNNSIALDKDFYFNCFTGISKLLSNELYYSITKEHSSPTRNEIYENLKNFTNNISENPSFTIFSDNEGYLKDYYCTHLSYSYANYKTTNYDDPNILMDTFYSKKDKQDRLQNKSTDLQRLINTNIDRCNKKSNILKETLKECEKKDDYKIKGDLLTSYIYSIKKGDNECSLLNFYNESKEEYIKISLDKTKTPSENIQRYYKKYNKLKASEEHAILELEKNNNEVEYLNSVLTNILNVESYDEIDEIKNELIETGYIRYKKKDKQKKAKISKPHHFTSSDNIDIYVGKNNIQNDYLSLKFANKNFLWLHAKDIPGSHVIVCAFDVPDKTLEEAAIIAGFYSKGKNNNKLSVDYTKVKELKKPNGSKPGMVIYHKNNTIVINPNDFNTLFNN